MSFDIFSVDFFKQIAKMKADSNADGQISEKEKSIFDMEYKKFDKNNDGNIDEQDVLLYRQAVTFTEEEKINMAYLKKFREQHPNFNIRTATEEEKSEFIKLANLVGTPTVLKEEKNLDFKKDIKNLVKYLDKTNVSLTDKYWHSISQWFGIDNSKGVRIEDVQKEMNSLSKLSLVLAMRFDTGEDAQKLANDLTVKIINTADMAPDDYYVQREAINNLGFIQNTGIDNKELIDDIKVNLCKIKSDTEQILKNTTDDEYKQYLNEKITSIDELIGKW